MPWFLSYVSIGLLIEVRFSPQEIFDIGLAGYLHELRMLVDTFNSDSLPEILPQFSHYESFLNNISDQHYSRNQILELMLDKQVINVGSISKIDERLFTFASLAAACEIFHGWTIDAGNLTAENCSALLQENIQISGSDRHKLGQIMGVRLNCGDAVRVVQIIKLLGLLPLESTQYDQLALGASMARRDRLGFHRIPGIGPDRPGGQFSVSSRLNFAVKACPPKSLVIIDNDKNLAADYEQINRSESPTTQALNLDLYDGLEHLKTTIERGDCSPRNLVTMFRLEPRALPDIPLFLKKLNPVVSDSAFFLATIGSGDTDSEFVARQAAMEQFMTQLQSMGLKPLRIIMHDSNSQATGRARPLFGVSEFASFEILFCKLSSAISARP